MTYTPPSSLFKLNNEDYDSPDIFMKELNSFLEQMEKEEMYSDGSISPYRIGFEYGFWKGVALSTGIGLDKY